MSTADARHNPLHVLVVDDEVNIRKTLALCLELDGHRVFAVSNDRDAVAAAAQQAFDVAFVDLRLGTANGLDLLPLLKASTPWLKIIVITAYASIDTAVEAMRRGASDYLSKPFTPAQVQVAVAKVAQVRALEQRLEALEEDLGRTNPEVDFTSSSPAVQRAVTLAREVAPSETPVLVRGESGTGKGVLVRAMHAWSHRAHKPFATVACAARAADELEGDLFGHAAGALPGTTQDHPGRLAGCDGGTLHLDELGDLPLSLQPKLLRFLNDHEYQRLGDATVRRADVRLISTSSADLEQAASAGRLREDLLYRLSALTIELPPLRERADDVPGLADRLLRFFASQHHQPPRGFTAEAYEALKRYHWPGNLRELRNVVERANILCQGAYIGSEHLPEKLLPTQAQPRIGDRMTLEQLEEMHIRLVLSSSKSLQEAADILGIDQATLWRRRKRYSI